MAPRNNDASSSYKKKNFPVEDSEVDVKNVVPCLLHKKHKVVKLIKSQLQKIQEEGLICGAAGSDAEVYLSEEETGTRRVAQNGEVESGTRRTARSSEKGGPSRENRPSSAAPEGNSYSSENGGNGCMCLYFLGFLLLAFILLFLMVWISAGPLSNTVAHTPISSSSFVRTDSLCTLEKKYLLRWSKPEYYE